MVSGTLSSKLTCAAFLFSFKVRTWTHVNGHQQTNKRTQRKKHSRIRSESRFQSKSWYRSLDRTHRSVSLFCATSKNWFHWIDGSPSKILFFKAVRFIELCRLKGDPVIKGKLLYLLLIVVQFHLWLSETGRRGVCLRLRWEDTQIDYQKRVTKNNGQQMSKSV